MKHLCLACLLLSSILLSGCSSTREAKRAKERQAQLSIYIQDLWQQEPVKADSLSGYLPNPEINLLDALQRKYPGRVKTRRVVRVDTVRLPGKTITITLPVVHDTVQAIGDRDSLLSELRRAALNAKDNSELRAAYANLQVKLLQYINAHGCLPDTLVEVNGFGFYFTMHIIPRPGGVYDFELVKARQDIAAPVEVEENNHDRVVQTPVLLWYRDKWFYVALALFGLFVWVSYLRFRDAKPAAAR